MKIFAKYILLPIIVLMSVSCSDLLDVEAEGTISGDVLVDDESIQDALNGAYYNFTGIADDNGGGELVGGDFIIIPTLLARRRANIFQEIGWQSVNAPFSYNDFIEKSILETNGRVAANWVRAYETINQLNTILANLENIEDSNTRNRIEGEALAMRGILYFEMVKLWAPHYRADGVNPETTPAIPIRMDPLTDINEIPVLTSSDLSSVGEVYDRAETDLRDASLLLESFGKNSPNLSYYACQGYLARLHMQKGEYGQARSACDNIISSMEFSLNPTPLDAFNNPENTDEDIFAIQQTLANNTGDRTTSIGLTAFYSSLVTAGFGTFGVFEFSLDTEILINSPRFSDNDLRGTIDINVDEGTTASNISTMYYRNIANNLDELLSPAKYLRADNVLPVMRLAEIYLMRAESTFESLGANVNQQAVDDLNMVRTRAGLEPVQLSDFDADPFLFFDLVVLERKRELIHEGHLLHDLKRWRFFSSSPSDYFVGATLAGESFDPWDDRFILPIPQAEVNTWRGGD